MAKNNIFIYPTESSYAIGCRFNDRAAIKRIMQLKGRKDPQFTVIAASLQQAKTFFKLNAAQLRLAKRYWPGSVSIVVSKQCAVRVPKASIARNLAKLLGYPILATSLNLTGEPPLFSLNKLPQQFRDLPQIDAGKLKKQLPSTVVECTKHGYKVHRYGAVTITE